MNLLILGIFKSMIFRNIYIQL